MNKYENILKLAEEFFNVCNTNFRKIAYIKKLPNGKYRVFSEKGKNLGTYDSKDGAKKRLRQIEFFKHRDQAATDDKEKLIDLTNIADFSLSAVMRELRQNANKEQVREFLQIYKKIFDTSVKNKIQKPEKIALQNSLIKFNKKYKLKVNKKLIKIATITELGDAQLVGKYLSNIVKFTLNKLPPDKRQAAQDKLKNKFLNLDANEMSKKYLPETSAMGQAITFVKHVLFNHDTDYIRKVLNSLSENL